MDWLMFHLLLDGALLLTCGFFYGRMREAQACRDRFFGEVLLEVSGSLEDAEECEESVLFS